jgi:hypothetical protein
MADVNFKSMVNIKTAASIKMEDSIKTSFSIYHLFGAANCARASHKIEKEIKPPAPEKERMEYVGFVTSSVIMSVAALESRINEIYLSAVDKDKYVFSDFEDNILESLSDIWNDIENINILLKYQSCLILSNKIHFNKGNSPYENVSLLINLRNQLIHYKPEWDTALGGKHKNLEKRLGNKYEISPYSHKNDAFFPKKCLSHGCASWAVNSVINFIDCFYKKMGIQGDLSPFKDGRLSTEIV